MFHNMLSEGEGFAVLVRVTWMMGAPASKKYLVPQANRSDLVCT